MEYVKKLANKAERWMRSRRWQVAVLLFVSGAVAGRAQVTPLPFASSVAGLAPGTSAAVCSAALNKYGDGCPAAQASITVGYLSSLWTDRYGNVYFVDTTGSYEVRVIYEGGAPLANLITINNPSVTAPQVGYVYAIAGSAGRTSGFASGSYCNGASGTVMKDIAGDGCPGYEAFTEPRGGSTDADGDVFLADYPSFQAIRVIYAGGAAAANLIKLENSGTTPVVGSIYQLAGYPGYGGGYRGDGGLALSKNTLINSPLSLELDVSGNLYIADSGNNAVRVISASNGYISTVAGGGCATSASSGTPGCTAGFTGDSGAATSAELKNPHGITFDASGNLYISDYGNSRVRVIYKGGTLLGINSPTVNNIYTVIGGGSSTTPGVTAQNLQLSGPIGTSFDTAGNIYVPDLASAAIYRVDGKTGVVSIFAGVIKKADTVGGYCNGSTGPTATDTTGDGCPGTYATVYTPASRLAFAPNGVGYLADATPYPGGSTVVSGLIRAFSYNPQFAATAVGSSSTAWAAVSSTASFAAPAISASVEGTSTGEFTGATSTCTAGTSYAASTACSYKLTFTPALPGRRIGEFVFSQSGTTVLTRGVDAEGLGSLLAVTPNAAATTLGSSIAKSDSITADSLGNLYVSDSSTGTLWRIASGTTTPVALLTGLSSPAQSAVDGEGNVYVADTGNNHIVEYTASGSTVSLLTGLSGPKGLAVTGNGSLYVADTGNSRILFEQSGATSASALPITGLNAPSALALDASNDLFIADTGNKQVVEYASQIQSAISFGVTDVQPVGLAVDAAGDIYVSDGLTNSVLRMVSGSPTGTPLTTRLQALSGIAVDGLGDLFYADTAVAGLKELVQQKATIAFEKTNKGDTSSLGTAYITNLGNVALNFTSSPGYSGTGDTAGFTIGAGTSGCGTASIAVGANCSLEANFVPQATGPLAETVLFQTNAANNSTAALNLSGEGVNLIHTTTSLSYTPSSLVYGSTATFTVTIVPVSGSGTPSGNVAVTVDGTAYQTVPLNGTTATFTATFAAGTHVVQATYSGDDFYVSSYNSTSFTVGLQGTTTVLTYTLDTTNSALILTAQVIPNLNGKPSGTVTFYSGSSILGTAAISNGTATYMASISALHSNVFGAHYTGDANYLASDSSNVTPSSTFYFLPSTNVLNAVAGYPVATTLTPTSYFGYSGTFSMSCAGLPANSICRFQPATVTLTSGSSTNLTLEIFTNVSTGAQANGIAGGKCGGWMILSLLASLVLFHRTAGVRRRIALLVPALLLMTALFCSVMGCEGSSTAFNPTTTPPGTSTVAVTFTDGSGNSQTVTYTLNVTEK